MTRHINQFKIILEDLNEKENIVNPAGIAVSHKLGGYGLPGTGATASTSANTSASTAKAGTAKAGTAKAGTTKAGTTSCLSGKDDYLGGSL